VHHPLTGEKKTSENKYIQWNLILSMKTYLYALTLAGLLCRCVEEKANPAQLTAEIDQEFTVKPYQSILLTSAADGAIVDPSRAIKVQVIAASDSLCPTGFQCVTAGSAKVTLQVSRGQSSSDTLYLCLGDCDYYLANSPFKGDSAVFQLDGASYAARFKSLQSSGKGWEKTVQQVTMLIESR
jgi:hypothetical protein